MISSYLTSSAEIKHEMSLVIWWFIRKRFKIYLFPSSWSSSPFQTHEESSYCGTCSSPNQLQMDVPGNIEKYIAMNWILVRSWKSGMIVFFLIAYLVESNVDNPCGDEGAPTNTNHGLHGCWRQVLGISVVINNLHVVMNLVNGVNGQTKVNSQSNSSYLYISSNWWTKESI